MAVGIEDASMFHGMKTGRIPPIANHKETDPELGNLNLSTGGDYPNLKYGLRFAAGFGSQMALSLVRRWPVVGERIDGAKFLAWNRKLAGTEDVVLRLLDQKLVAYVDGDDNLHGGVQGKPWPITAPFEGKPSIAPAAAAPDPVAPTPSPAKPSPPPVGVVSSAPQADVASTVIDVVVTHTGYPADFVELDQDLEGELGIDTVKQAEIMADIREQFSLPIDEEFVLSDYPTLNHMIEYIGRMSGGAVASSPMVAPPAVAPEPVKPAAPAPQAVAPVPPAAPVVDDSQVQSIVVEVVVKHTGYPADFIELDQDLEGELGIDTVKQAEIMADIREQFGLPVDEDFVLSDHPTLNHMIAYIQRFQGGAGSAPSGAAKPAPAMVPSKPEPTPVVELPTQPLASDEEVDTKLIEIVVKHTGYPADFIEMDQDLEGELGIDTVKQAEIMGDVRELFALPLDEDFVLSDHPTLNHFTAYILRMKGGHSAEPTEEASSLVEPVAHDKALVSDAVARTVPNRRWQIEVEAAPGVHSPLSLAGTAVVTDDGWGIAEAFCERLEADGMNAIRIGFESNIRDMSVQQEGKRLVYRANPANPEHVAAVCAALADQNITALVHMSPLKLASATWAEDHYPSSQIALAAQGYFSLLQGLDAHFSTLDSGVIASVTAMDGRHGNIGERFNAVQCAASGVTKSYAFEQLQLRCRALDVHPELILDPVQAAQLIHHDVFNLAGEVEVGLDRDERRWGLVAFAEDLVEDRQPLASDDTWLVSGGGSGVTASSLIAVSESSFNSGAHFALLGRSHLIEQTKAWVTWDEDALETERIALRERLVNASKNGKVTIVEWNKAWQRFTRSRDVYSTMASIESTGNSASYHAVDVTDLEGMRAVGASLKRPITGLIHGAGLEDSKLVADKEFSTFDQVVRVKVDGWRCMLAASEASGTESLRLAVCFTSVAGRFGNGGQTDYAAANSVLDAEMARLTASGKCRAVAIGWTGWRDVGMATRGSIEAVFAAAGIATLSVDEGVNIFADEVLAGGKRRVIACGSLGTMDHFDAFRDAPLRLPAEMAGTIADPSRFPFVDKVLALKEGQSLTVQSTLSVADHPFLGDHAIEGVPYHPGVMALEMFAEASLLLRPSTCLAGFESVEFGLPVKLLKGAMTVRVHAEYERSEGDLSWISCRLVSDLTNSKGEVFGEREHHAARVRVVEKSEDLWPFLQSEVDALPDLGVPPQGELAEHPSFIYRRYFHGPRFQSHGGVLRGVGDASMPGADGIALMRHQLPATDQFAQEREGEAILLEALPMLIEAGFQNAGLVAMESVGFSSLPVGIEWSSMLRVPERDETLRLRSIQTAAEEAGVTVHDVVIVGDDDAPVLALKGLRLKGMAPVSSDDAFTLER